MHSDIHYQKDGSNMLFLSRLKLGSSHPSSEQMLPKCASKWCLSTFGAKSRLKSFIVKKEVCNQNVGLTSSHVVQGE
jgi:hypothetical protein